MMESYSIIFLMCVSVLFGMILTIFLQYCILLKYFKQSCNDRTKKKVTSEIYSLPEALKKHLSNNENYNNDESKHCSVAISLLFQFLFHEMRHSDLIKRWLYKKLSLEFDELLTKTTTGKFFVAVTIRDMNLGSQFPDIKSFTVDNVVLNKTHGFIDTLNLCVELDYSGNFLLSVDAKMKFGKTAYLSITVKRISGLARLQFTRLPYTHWSFSFCSDPLIELGVESQFQGRQLQTNITNLIINQIKKAIKKKHTLPNYKIRYKPFFNKTDPSQLESDDYDVIIQPHGVLNLNCIEVTRLALLPSDIINNTVYCTFTIDSIPWIRLTQTSDSTASIVMDINMVVKNRRQQLGVVFKQEESIVMVETIVAQSSAAKSGLRSGDILLAIDTKSVTSMSQVAKLIKSISASAFVFRIQRTVMNYVFNKNNANIKSEFDETNKSPKISNSNENLSKLAYTIGNFSLRKRKSSIVDQSPTTVVQQRDKLKLKRSSLDLLNNVICYETCAVAYDDDGTMIVFNCEHSFPLRTSDRYLNVNVWSRMNDDDDDDDILLGYTNIPLANILNECSNSLVGYYLKSYSFLPPDHLPNKYSSLLSSHSGFEHCFCYGDILLSFVWLNNDNIDDDDDSKQLQQQQQQQLSTSTKKEEDLKHDFIRTQFHRTTHCDFCLKKIWLKDAVQCRNCALCCHKKCVLKCQTNKMCLLKCESVEQPEITTTEIVSDEEQQQVELNSSSNKQYNNTYDNGMKRVNSTNSLAIPGASTLLYPASCQCRSLPPSPQHTPSRKQSIVNLNPFLLCPTLLETCYYTNPTVSIDQHITEIIDQLLQCNQYDNLMDMAKETGIQYYSTIPHDQRTEKINRVMTELKNTLDRITFEHTELTKQLNRMDHPTEKAKLAFLVGQADAKVHALSVLMLHYCSGLQQVQEKII